MIAQFNQELFNKMPVVGILRNIPLKIIKEIIPVYLKAGFTTIEVTMNSENVVEIIQYLSTNFKNLNVGAGTVCTINDLHLAIDAGASYIVTPIIDEEVINHCVENKIPIFPGAYTPTEIYIANKLGATAVKVFPATQLGPTYIKDVLAPLNTLKLLPTGGVSLENIDLFFKAGAKGVGMGSSLFHKEYIATKNYEMLFQHFKSIATKVSNL